MHVAIVGHTAALSGGELALIRLLPYLRADDLQISVVLAQDGPLVAEAERIGVEVVVLPLGDAVRDRRRADTGSLYRSVGLLAPTAHYVRTVRRFLVDHHVDLVHTNTLKAAVYGGLAARSAGIPLLWHIRDRIAADYLPRSTTHSMHALARVLPHRIAVNSATTAAAFPAAVQDRISLVPDSVERPPTLVRSTVPDVRTTPGFTVGMVGRLSPWKGQDVVLEAFARAFGADRSVSLRFVGSSMFGETDYEQELRSRTELLGLSDRVEFRGFRSDVWQEYAAFDVAVHASVVPEPFGQVVIEAMAAGVPVIASAAGGPAEVVTDGQDGILVPPHDVAGLASAMTKLEHDAGLRHRLARNGIETAARYSPLETVRALRGLYAGLADRRLVGAAR